MFIEYTNGKPSFKAPSTAMISEAYLTSYWEEFIQELGGEIEVGLVDECFFSLNGEEGSLLMTEYFMEVMYKGFHFLGDHREVLDTMGEFVRYCQNATP